MWHGLENIKRLETGEISAEVTIGPDSAWFCGHFPDDPIVPGVAQLGIVLEVLQLACEQSLAVTEISRIRFRRIIRPNEPMKILITPTAGSEGAFVFRLMAAEEMVCNGFMKVKTGATPHD